MTTRIHAHNDYTVGWVCALPKEQTAATAMLEERHTDLPKPSNDPNTYTLGSISGHNIVIVCLPKGKIGTVSAANVATHMIHAFPAIRFGLMVGIGGGVPPKVRLGDVVVSVPIDQYPGVVQWDMGKAEQDRSFRRTGALNNTPTLLLTALTKLETDHALQGTKIPQYLEELEERYPRIAAQYLRSDHLNDVLFKAGYDHVNQHHGNRGNDDAMQEESDGDAVDDCRYCDRNQIVKRKPRDFCVHSGLIASGNQVIKDANSRDQLFRDLDQKVLCIDMEAAGLMDGFPCIVIRGICDYADSHKNKSWQEHSAIMAAAFAKELLGYVIAHEVDEEKPVKALLGTIPETMKAIREDTTKIAQVLNRGEDMVLIDWISAVNYGTQQSDALKRWHPATNQWFICSTEYQDWVQTRGRTIYCHGIPGAGKTTLTSAVVANLDYQFSSDMNVGLAYVYFSYSRQLEQTVEPVLASLLAQLIRSLPSVPDHVRGILKSHRNKGTQPLRAELLTALNIVVSEYQRTFIILDALGECASPHRAEILNVIRDLQKGAMINILATSRPVDEIATQLKGRDTTIMSIVAHDQDMNVMLQSRMRTLDQDIYDENFRERVVSKIIQTAKGMFLLADLYLNVLTVLPTKGDILHALDNLDQVPEPLDAVYELTMERIESQGSGFAQLARNILQWIVHARRNISCEELKHALAIRQDTRAIDTDYCPSSRRIKSICAGLVIVDEESDTVRLVHHTTQEYFAKLGKKWFPNGHDQITESCVTYLSFEAFDGHCATDAEFKERLVKFPFYSYASKEWGYHAKFATSQQKVVNFLKKERQVQAAVQSLFTGGSRHVYWENSQKFPLNMNGLHLASHLGLEKTVGALLTDFDVNARDEYCRTPLSWAALKGHVSVVERLLASEKTDINLTDDHGRTPLTLAALHRHKGVVYLLLQAEGVDIYGIDAEHGQTPLSLAAGNGHETAIQLLLQTRKVDANSKDSYCGETPLLWACKKGHDDVVRLLLSEEEVDAGKADDGDETSLSWAATSGNETIVELLLFKEGMNVDAPDRTGRTPLSWAASSGHNTIVQLLLKTERVGVDSADTHGRTPLSWAASSGHEAIVGSLLFTEAVDVNSQDHGGRTPLSWAALLGNYDVVELLLCTQGVNIDLQDHEGKTPLSWAASNGHYDVVRLILNTELANVSLRDNNGRTPISWAINKGWEDIANALIDASEEICRTVVYAY